VREQKKIVKLFDYLHVTDEEIVTSLRSDRDPVGFTH